MLVCAMPARAAAGRFNPDIGGASVSACIASPKGMYAPTEGAKKAKLCAPGYHQELEGQAQCRPCPLGRYQPQEGEAGCLASPKGACAPQNGSQAATRC
eukprot:373126-Prymnesium_polylepis.1